MFGGTARNSSIAGGSVSSDPFIGQLYGGRGSRGAGLFLEILDSQSILRPIPVTSQDALGRNLQIVIPFDASLTLVPYASFYHVNNASGTPLGLGSTTKIPLLVPSGQQLATIMFSIAGGGQ